MRIRARFVLVGLAWAVLGPAHALQAEMNQPGDAARGQGLFVRYCSGCHGEDGRGEAKTFQPYVGNLAVKELIDQVPDEYLVAVIKNGGASVGKNAAMPAWKKQLDDRDIWDLVAFVRTLGRH